VNKYLIGASAIFVGVLVYLVVVGGGGSTPADSQEIVSRITLDRVSHDFGDIDIFGGKVNAEFMLKNEGAQDVTITSGVTSCMCTEGEIGDLRFGMHGSTGNTVVIPAGSERTLTAIFDPLAHGPEGTGQVTRQLMLETDSSVTPEIQVRFTGNVVKNS